MAPQVSPARQRRRAGGVTTIEDQVRFAYETPAPGTYDQALPEPSRLGPKISEAHVPSPLDYAPKTSAHVPGPGTYAADGGGRFALPEGGRVNRRPPQERLKLDEYPVPAPGAYGVPSDPAVPRSTYGRFSRDPRVTKFIQDEVVRSRGVPGPGTHEVQESQEAVQPFCPEGGRTLGASKPASYFDKAPTLADGNPPPDQYNLPGAIKKNKTAGRLVYRYESATMAETRDLVNRMAAESHEAPGPGTYNLPDPPPIHGVPKLKSRALPHGMPAPYAYNCTPDLSRKFMDLAPVRQQNSADQIYGNGLKPGEAANRAKKGSRPSSAGGGDRLQPEELPAALRGVEEESEETVQWRSGGFAGIRRSRSGPAIQRQLEHPSIVQARRSYPQLAGRGRDASAARHSASRASDSVSTHEMSEENQRLRRGKWELSALAERTRIATAEVLEPLDVDKLKQDALAALQDKAQERMKLEGVPRRQINQVLKEMPDVLEEHRRGTLGREAAPTQKVP